ncbi:MAG TPA: thioesterase family protein [Clostridia bacterium]|nr:thioesterase family protein [Clostridia bacterium]
MFFSETHFVVRYAETDQMGIVHHSNYPIWFEAGRTDFIKKLGLPYSRIEELGILLPLIELKCCYKGAAKYEDEVTVRTRIKKFTPVRIVFCYEVLKSDGNCITTGETMHVWTTKELKPISLQKHKPDIYKLICMASE